jgi:hypothetical protein
MTTPRLSDRLRDELAAELAPCPTCGHRRTTIVALAGRLGVGPSALGRFLAGATPSVPLIDAAEAFLATRHRERPALTAVGPE